MRRLIAHLTGVLLLLLPIVAQALPTATPEEVGLSRERLARIAPALSRQIEAKSFPGAVAIVARKGRIAYFEAIGQLDPKSARSEEHTSELQSRLHLVCRLLLENK